MENTTTSSSDKLILIVDDDKGVRELLQIIVEKEGFKTAMAEDGHEALQKARALVPHLILLDLMLPGAGGFEVVHELQQEETAAIPVVMMTGRFMDQSTAEMIKREANVREYLEKPLKTAALAALLHRLLKTQPPARKTAL